MKSTATQMLEVDAKTDEIARQIVDAAYKVHTSLGPGLLEAAYENCLAHEIGKRGLKVEKQVSLPVYYDDLKIDAGFRLDLLVEETLVVEIKAVESLLPVHKAQILTYLKLMRKPLGLLINFNVALIKQGIQRVILTIPEHGI